MPLLRELEREFGSERVSVVAIESVPTANGKVQNLLNAMTVAKHDYLVISDSDVLLASNYLTAIMAPLSDERVGFINTLYRGTHAESWYEHLERLTYNADFIPSVIFALLSNASGFCLGASIASRRSTLDFIGGMEDLADYLVEDYELGRRILASGYRMALVQHSVDLMIDLESPSHWWQHQLYWDQNTWSAQPVGFFSTLSTKSLPFALLYACVSHFDPVSLSLLLATVALRTATVGLMLSRIQGSCGLQDFVLLPVRDVGCLFSSCAAICKKSFVWRGHEFLLARNGRIVPRGL